MGKKLKKQSKGKKDTKYPKNSLEKNKKKKKNRAGK